MAGYNPDGLSKIFHLLNPSGRTMALGSTQAPSEVNTKIFHWGHKRPVRWVPLHVPVFGKPRSLPGHVRG